MIPSCETAAHVCGAAREQTRSGFLDIPNSGRGSRRLVDWIWTISGSVPLPAGQSGKEAIDRLEPLFGQPGTVHQRTDDGLAFRKRGQAAQDRMAIFDTGTLGIGTRAAAPALCYRLTSRALLFCFLAPLLFLAIAQLTVALNRLEKPAAESSKKHGKHDAAPALNPIDKALGAPKPEKPDKKKGRDKKPTATPGYVFAGIFATLYVAGRILEDRLVRNLFRKSLLGS